MVSCCCDGDCLLPSCAPEASPATLATLSPECAQLSCLRAFVLALLSPDRSPPQSAHPHLTVQIAGQKSPLQTGHPDHIHWTSTLSLVILVVARVFLTALVPGRACWFFLSICLHPLEEKFQGTGTPSNLFSV